MAIRMDKLTHEAYDNLFKTLANVYFKNAMAFCGYKMINQNKWFLSIGVVDMHELKINAVISIRGEPDGD